MRLDAMGDVLMSGPAMRALKQASPGRSITLLTSPAGAEAGRLLKEVDEVLVYSAPWVKSTPPLVSRRADQAMIQVLGQRRFDAAVIFTVYTQSPLPAAMLCYLAGIPLRLAHCHENPYELLTDWVYDSDRTETVRHEVQRQLDLVAAVGAVTPDHRMRAHVSEHASRAVADLLLDLGLSTRSERPEPPKPDDEPKNWAVIHAGASAPSRRYPATQFAEVAESLIRAHGFRLLFTGSEFERSLVDEILNAVERSLPGTSRSAATSKARAINLAGKLTLDLFAALLRKSPILISNNTGAVHLAASVEAPVVDLYALTNPQHTPWQVPSRVLSKDVPCKLCLKSVCPRGYNECLRGVHPLTVVDAVLELLAEMAERGGYGKCLR